MVIRHGERGAERWILALFFEHFLHQVIEFNQCLLALDYAGRLLNFAIQFLFSARVRVLHQSEQTRIAIDEVSDRIAQPAKQPLLCHALSSSLSKLLHILCQLFKPFISIFLAPLRSFLQSQNGGWCVLLLKIAQVFWAGLWIHGGAW